jgi:hypothetical protein
MINYKRQSHKNVDLSTSNHGWRKFVVVVNGVPEANGSCTNLLWTGGRLFPAGSPSSEVLVARLIIKFLNIPPVHPHNNSWICQVGDHFAASAAVS